MYTLLLFNNFTVFFCLLGTEVNWYCTCILWFSLVATVCNVTECCNNCYCIVWNNYFSFTIRMFSTPMEIKPNDSGEYRILNGISSHIFRAVLVCIKYMYMCAAACVWYCDVTLHIHSMVVHVVQSVTCMWYTHIICTCVRKQYSTFGE